MSTAGRPRGATGSMDPITLAFKDRQLEKRFRSHFAASRLFIDRAVGLMATLYPPIFAINFKQKWDAASATATNLKSCSTDDTSAAASCPATASPSDPWQQLELAVLASLLLTFFVRFAWQILVWFAPTKHPRMRLFLVYMEWLAGSIIVQFLRASNCLPSAPGSPSPSQCVSSMTTVAISMVMCCAIQRLPLVLSFPCFLLYWLVAAALTSFLNPAVPWYGYFPELLAAVALPVLLAYALERPARISFLAAARAAAEEKKLQVDAPNEAAEAEAGPSSTAAAGASSSSSSSKQPPAESSGAGNVAESAAALALRIRDREDASISSGAASPWPGSSSSSISSNDVGISEVQAGSSSNRRAASGLAPIAVAAAGGAAGEDAEEVRAVHRSFVPGEHLALAQQSPRPVSYYQYRSPLCHRFVSVKVEGPDFSLPDSNGTTASSSCNNSVAWLEVQDRVTQVLRSALAAHGAGNQIIQCTMIRGCIRLLYKLLGAGGLPPGFAAGFVGGNEGGGGGGAAANANAIMEMLAQQAAAAVGPGNEVMEVVLLDLGGEGVAAWPVGGAGRPWALQVVLEPPVLVAPASIPQQQQQQQQEDNAKGIAAGDEQGVLLGLRLPDGLVRELLGSGSSLRVVVSEVSREQPLYEQRWTPAQLQQQLERVDGSDSEDLQVQLRIPAHMLARMEGDGAAAAAVLQARVLVVSVLQLLPETQNGQVREHHQHHHHVGRERAIAFPRVLLLQGSTAAAGAAAAVGAELSYLYQQMLQQQLQPGSSATYNDSWSEFMEDFAAVAEPSLLRGLMGALGSQACLDLVRHLVKYCAMLGLGKSSAMLVKGVGSVPELLEQLLVAATREEDVVLLGLLELVSMGNGSGGDSLRARVSEQQQAAAAAAALMSPFTTTASSSSSGVCNGVAATAATSSSVAKLLAKEAISNGSLPRQQQVQGGAQVYQPQWLGCMLAALWGFQDERLEESYQQSCTGLHIQHGRVVALLDLFSLTCLVWTEVPLLLSGRLLATYGPAATYTAVAHVLSNSLFTVYSVLLLLGRPAWLLGRYRGGFACLRDAVKLGAVIALGCFGAGHLALTQVLNVSVREPKELAESCFSTTVLLMVFARVVVLRLQPYWLQLHAAVLAVFSLVCWYRLPLLWAPPGRLLGFGPVLGPWVQVVLGACIGVLLVVLQEGRSRAVYLQKAMGATPGSVALVPKRHVLE